MNYADFLQLNKKYRIITEWDNDLKIPNKESGFIYCYNGKVRIYPISDTIIQVHSLSSVDFSSRIKEKYNIDIVQHGENGEFVLEFNSDLLEKIIDIFKPKKAPKQAVPPHSVRNINLWLRYMRNIDPRYQDILNKRLKSDNEEE